MSVVTFGAVLLLWTMVGSDNNAPPAPPLPPGVKAPPPPGPVPPPEVEAWWDKLPDRRLANMVLLLKKVLPPDDQALFDSLGDTADTARLAPYQKLTERLPELSRNQQVKGPLGRFLSDCYALEPAEKNVTALRTWFVSQIPKEDAEYPASFKGEDLERSFWALNVGLDALTHPAIPPDRRKPLTQALGKALGFDIGPAVPQAELRLQAEKLLALRCYNNLAPTAEKSLDGALAIREALVKKVPQYLSPNFREKIDLDIAVRGLASARTSWPAYSSLLQDLLVKKNPAMDLAMIQVYEQADPETAGKMEPILAGKWKVLEDRAKTREAKVKDVQKQLGFDPRMNQFEELASKTLDSANSPPNKSRALLQETARLAHASTLACALLQKEAGQARFDEWIKKVPAIEQGDPGTPSAKGSKPTKPAGNSGGTAGANPKNISVPGQLTPGALSKEHIFAMKRGKTYEILLQSTAFDAYLFLESSKRERLAEDDDSGGGLNALIVHTAQFDDNYKVIATSLGSRSIGPYVLSVREFTGFGAPGFGGPGFPVRPFPFQFRRPPFGIPPPGMVPGMLPPQQPPPVVVEKPEPAAGSAATAQIDKDDLASLHEKNPAKTRVTAFLNIVANLPDDLAKSDLTPRDAQAIARFLLTIKTKEVAEVLPKMASVARSRNLLLAVADRVDQPDAEQKASEAIVGALVGQPLQSGKDDNWSLRCRKLLLTEALEIADKQKNAATQAADILRDQYKEQGILLGMGAPGLKKLSRPAQMMESVIKHLADKVGKQNPAPEQKERLDKVQRELRAAQFVAQNDLEYTVMLQRVWLKVLSLYLEPQRPERTKEMRELQQESSDGDRASPSVLEQLRGGEERILRLWVLAHDLK